MRLIDYKVQKKSRQLSALMGKKKIITKLCHQQGWAKLQRVGLNKYKNEQFLHTVDIAN